MNGEATIEEERRMELEMRRREADLERQARKASSRARPRIGLIGGLLILAFAIGVDVLDYLFLDKVIPLLLAKLGPVVAIAANRIIDFLEKLIDVFAGFVIWLWIKIKGLERGRSPFFSWSPWLATFVEFITSLPPSFTIDVIVIMILNSKWGRRMARILSPI